MSIQIDAGDIVATIALAISALSALATFIFYRHQQKINQTTDELNRLLIKREAALDQERLKADISANFVKIGKNNRRLKVFNRGKCAARNVRIEFPEGNELLIKNDVDSKFPAQILEQHQSIELIAAFHMGSPTKMKIKLIWDDDSGTNNEKVAVPTL